MESIAKTTRTRSRVASTPGICLSILITCLAMFVSACSHGDDAGKKPSSYHLQALEMHNANAPANECIAMQQLAVDQVHRGTCPDNPVEVLAQMGQLYNSMGDYTNGIEYLQEAAEYLREHPECGGSDGEIQLYGDLGAMHVSLGLAREGLAMNDLAIQASLRQKGRMLSDIYRMRSYAYDVLGMPDSVKACYQMALDAIDRYDTQEEKSELRDGINIEMADLVFSTSADKAEIKQWLDTANAIAARSDWDYAGQLLTLGRGYVAMGDTDRGMELIEKGMDDLKRQHDVTSMAMTARILIDLYARTGHRRWPRPTSNTTHCGKI